MFDQLFVESMKRDQNNTHHELELDGTFTESVQLKTPLISRAFAALGDILIRTGVKFKKYSRNRINPETAQAPTFIIML